MTAESGKLHWLVHHVTERRTPSCDKALLPAFCNRDIGISISCRILMRQ